ncbi:arginase family protein [Bradyrhizobium sp. SZCCHNR1002]|uniref:arginase family protein n=1 Tax=Bradyrhizobium sp. SZCCHNR1002 TaxID=3057334 RepID=UPI0028E20BC5|nr:arginase family protein [Bradyrhizobium sp. SZCCHNR1002]
MKGSPAIMARNWLDELNRDSWRAWQAYSLPPWCTGGPGLFGAKTLALVDESETCDVAVCSVGFDGTASTHIGARDGPLSIRKESLGFSSQMNSRRLSEVTNLRTGLSGVARAPDIADFGDLHVFPSNPARQVEATAAEAYELAHRCDLLVVLGGEHTISYPCFAGVREAMRAAGRTLGYVQIDHHFDFGEHSSLHGAFYHGSNARRISELPGLRLDQIGFVGQGDITGSQQLAGLTSGGCTIRHRRDIRRIGFAAALRETLDAVSAATPDGLYVSIDIDVCENSAAPGTGHVTVGGISAEELLMIGAILQDYPVRAIDVVEVNPNRDVSGRTSAIVARLLYEFLFVDWQKDAA